MYWVQRERTPKGFVIFSISWLVFSAVNAALALYLKNEKMEIAIGVFFIAILVGAGFLALLIILYRILRKKRP